MAVMLFTPLARSWSSTLNLMVPDSPWVDGALGDQGHHLPAEQLLLRDMSSSPPPCSSTPLALLCKAKECMCDESGMDPSRTSVVQHTSFSTSKDRGQP